MYLIIFIWYSLQLNIYNYFSHIVIEDYEFVPEAYGENLDTYLAIGWYRWGVYMFTTNVLDYGDMQHNVFWLRFNMQHFTLTASQRALLKKTMAFTVEIKPLVITTELEELYTIYKKHVGLEMSDSLTLSLGYDIIQADRMPFETYILTIRDGEKLIAYGILDNGAMAAAGIINVYHPQYAKYSLGKVLILQKALIAKHNNKQYYYPGYIGKEYTKFDYKLFVVKHIAEVWDVEKKMWVSYTNSKAFK